MMRRAITLILAILCSVSLYAQTTPNEWLEALHRTLGSRYATYIVVASEDMGGMNGYFIVDGDSYYLTLGAMEVYCDGKLRYEVNNSRKEVVEDRANLEATDILTNPTRAFDFISDSYALELVSGREDAAKIGVTPKGDIADMHIYIDVIKQGGRVLPESVTYDYDGESYTIDLSIVEDDGDAVPRWNKAEYRAYDIVSFL